MDLRPFEIEACGDAFRFRLMKLLVVLAAVVVVGCVVEPADDGSIWTVSTFSSSIPHAPELDGYKQLKSQAIEFRKYRVFHPDGLWLVGFDLGTDLISVTTASGKVFTFGLEWYPEEGGADAAAVYGFTKAGETLIVIQGTSDLVHEETRIKFVGERMTDLRRFAEKGPGMGEGAPGKTPKYKEFPTR